MMMMICSIEIGECNFTPYIMCNHTFHRDESPMVWS
jgi:hypothetical protein